MYNRYFVVVYASCKSGTVVLAKTRSEKKAKELLAKAKRDNPRRTTLRILVRQEKIDDFRYTPNVSLWQY